MQRNLTISGTLPTFIYKDPKRPAFIIEVHISNGEGCQDQSDGVGLKKAPLFPLSSIG